MAARSFLIRSPKEESDAAVKEAVLLGAKSAAIAGTVVAVPTPGLLASSSLLIKRFCGTQDKTPSGSLTSQLDAEL